MAAIKALPQTAKGSLSSLAHRQAQVTQTIMPGQICAVGLIAVGTFIAGRPPHRSRWLDPEQQPVAFRGKV